MHLSLVVLYLFCWTGRVSSSPRTQIGLVRCLINGLFFVFVFVCNQSIRQLNYGSRWRAKKNMPEHIHWILPTCLYIIFTFAMTKNYLHTMLFVFGWSILFYRFNVVLTMRNREEALAHCRARRVYILQSPPHCLHPPAHAANAISSLYNSYSFF